MTTPTYRMPARSVGTGAIVRRRTPAGATIDHMIDRVELRPGDEVRIDLVDPATGWGAFLVLDGSAEVEVVVPAGDDEPVDVEVLEDDDDDTDECIRTGFHRPAMQHPWYECPLYGQTDLADPDADPREMCLEVTIAGQCARWADHDGRHHPRILTAVPADGHPAWELCPACPHGGES